LEHAISSTRKLESVSVELIDFVESYVLPFRDGLDEESALSDLPNSGENPIVYMDISIKDVILGRIHILLYRNAFPAGVENFVRVANGKTYRTEPKGNGRHKFKKEINRSFRDCKFFNLLHRNYIVSGDIYNNDGTNSGTIYFDQPIPVLAMNSRAHSHNSKGIVSLVPFTDEITGQLLYDSTFMITLDHPKPSNIISDLDSDQIVIGIVYDGIYILDKMNELIKPYAGRKYPEFIISECGVYQDRSMNRITI